MPSVQTAATISTPQAVSIPCETNEKVERLRNQVRITIEKYQDFYDRTKNLEAKIESLDEVIRDLTVGQNIGTRMALRGESYPADSTLVELVRTIIEEKLKLPDLSRMVVVATKMRDGDIMFEVNTSIEKLRILTRAKEKLSKSKIQIVDI